MEDALVHSVGFLFVKSQNCLNPCFNGRCTSTVSELLKNGAKLVSLNPCFNGRCTSTTQATAPLPPTQASLNPCFNGRCTSTGYYSAATNTGNRSS